MSNSYYTQRLFQQLYFFFRLLGVYPPQRNRLIYRITTFSIYFFVNLINPLTVYISFYSNGSVKHIITHLPVAVGMFTCTLKLINTLYNVENFVKLGKSIRRLDERVKGSDEEQFIEGKIRTFSWIIISFLVDATFITIMASSGTVLHNKRVLMFNAWFPFDWENSRMKYCLIIGFQTVAGAFIIWQECLNESYPILFCYVIIAHLRLICMRVARIGYDTRKTCEENHVEFIRCIKDYNLVVELVAKMQKIIGHIYFLQILSVETILCTNVIYFGSIQDNIMEKVHVVCYVSAILFVSGFACYMGSELQHESQLLTNSIYSCNWMDQNIRFKKDVIRMMVRSQRNIKLMAGGVVEMSLSTFLMIIKSTYSLLALLKGFDD